MDEEPDQCFFGLGDLPDARNVPNGDTDPLVASSLADLPPDDLRRNTGALSQPIRESLAQHVVRYSPRNGRHFIDESHFPVVIVEVVTGGRTVQEIFEI